MYYEHVGFTGTRRPPSFAQVKALSGLIAALRAEAGERPVYFHHGDCIGADVAAALIAARYDFVVVAHPPALRRYRAFCEVNNIVYEDKDYLERNHDIVDAADVMLACPRSAEETQRSGTWATVRYARAAGKRIILIDPDGRCIEAVAAPRTEEVSK